MDESQLVRATEAAARSLATGGTTACADGTTLSATYSGGTRVVLRNSLSRRPAFSAERLQALVSDGIVRALVAGEPRETGKNGLT